MNFAQRSADNAGLGLARFNCYVTYFSAFAYIIVATLSAYNFSHKCVIRPYST